jgi:hypothetical protein
MTLLVPYGRGCGEKREKKS